MSNTIEFSGRNCKEVIKISSIRNYRIDVKEDVVYKKIGFLKFNQTVVKTYYMCIWFDNGDFRRFECREDNKDTFDAIVKTLKENF